MKFVSKCLSTVSNGCYSTKNGGSMKTTNKFVEDLSTNGGHNLIGIANLMVT